MVRLWRVMWLLVVLAACGPEPTPFPVDIPSTAPTSTPAAVDTAPIRYALDANTTGRVPDLSLLEANAEVTLLVQPSDPGLLGVEYDLIAAYGVNDGWTAVDNPPMIALVVNPAAVADPQHLDIVRRGIDPQAVTAALAIPGAEPQPVTLFPPGEARTLLANAGLPDGFELLVAQTNVPGAAEVAASWRTNGVFAQMLTMTPEEAQRALETETVQAALIAWAGDAERETWVNRYGAENVIDLYTTPVSYLAVPELQIDYTPGGFPLPRR